MSNVERVAEIVFNARFPGAVKNGTLNWQDSNEGARESCRQTFSTMAQAIKKIKSGTITESDLQTPIGIAR